MGRTSKKNENVTVEKKDPTVIQEEQSNEEVQKEEATKGVGESEKSQSESSEQTQESNSEQTNEQTADELKDKNDVPSHVETLMRLYPHYKEIWVTSRGFVHPAGVPKYLLKDAVLYKNKFHNK